MFVILMDGFLVLAGCESLAESVLSVAANANSSTEAGQIFYFYNESLYTVTIIDPAGNRTIPLGGGGNTQVRYNRQVFIYSIDYSPADHLVPSQSSGTHITLTGKWG
jgi:hypothetical protein